MKNAQKSQLLCLAIASALGIPALHAQSIVNENFNSAPWTIANPDARANGVIDTSATGWSATVGGDPTASTIQTLTPRFPTNEGWVFGGTYPPTDNNGPLNDNQPDGVINQFDFDSVESSFGGYRGGVGDAQQLKYTGTYTSPVPANDPSIAAYGRAFVLIYDAEVGINRFGQVADTAKKGMKFTSVTFNGANIAGSNSAYFENQAAATAGVTDATNLRGTQVLSVTTPAENYMIDPNASTNSDRGITARIERATPLADGDAVNLQWNVGGVTGAEARHIGIGVDNVKFVALLPGDNNADLQVDSTDLFASSPAFNNPAFLNPTFADGDYNGDDAVDSADLFAASPYFNSGLYAATTSGSAGDGKPSITYNTATGEMAIDSNGTNGVNTFIIRSASGILNGAEPTLPGSSFFTTNTNFEISQNFFSPTLPANTVFSLGNVAQTGLSEAFLLNDLTLQGGLSGNPNFLFDLQFVPEPSSALLLGLGTLALAGRRQRKQAASV